MKKFYLYYNEDKQRENKEKRNYENGYLNRLLYNYLKYKKKFVCVSKSYDKIHFSNEFNSSKIKVAVKFLYGMRNKGNLPKFVPKTYLPEYFTVDTKIDDTLWFVKPNREKQGKGIIITKDPKEYLNKDCVIQKQIIPNLINKRTWCLRYIMIAYCENNELSLWISNNGLMRYGLLPYDNDKSGNDLNLTLIGNRHYQKTNGHLVDKHFFQESKMDLLSDKQNEINYPLICNNLKTMTEDLKKMWEKNFDMSKEINKSHEVLGLDIMIKDNKPIIVEINRWPGFAILDKNCHKQVSRSIISYEKNIVKFIGDNFITNPLLNKQPKKGYFYKI